MAPKKSLKEQLKGEVKRDRIKAGLPPPASSTRNLGESLTLRGPDSEPEASKPRSFDSLFGDSDQNDEFDDLDTGSVEPAKAPTAVKPSAATSQDNLQERPIGQLKEELVAIILREGESKDREEKRALRLRKGALITRISRLERAKKEARVNNIKAPFKESFKNLPEPMTPTEKKHLMSSAERIAKARLTPTKPSLKRGRKESDDDDLDGEERFYSGKKKKASALAVSGHWGAEIHNYMPESQINTEEFNRLRNMAPEEKKLKRREITDRLKNAAEADRRKKQMEKVDEDEDSLFVE